ncbi:efflux RND transporter permease subunit [Acidobacteria bacterium AH-259-O06]|nr:efflux RND transporter permease subunit [Acidobacteria bacterium AH-259-O06]
MNPIEQDKNNPSRGVDPSTDRPSSSVGLADFSIRKPVTICMIFVSIVALGLISVFKIPLVLDPDVDFPFLGVRVPYRNATPGQIQESITKPLEEVLATVPGVQRMSARSSSDRASVSLYFDWGTDIGVLRAQIREKVDQIRSDLPDDVEHIQIRSFGTDDRPIIGGRIASGKDLSTSGDFLELKIKKPLERIPGVAEVEFWGVQRQEIDIYLRLDDVKRYRVDVGQLFRRLDSVNLNRSLGRVEDAGVRYSAIAQGTLSSVEEMENFPVNERGLRLSDIADIYYDNPASNFGQHLNGEYAVGFNVRKTSEANTVETVNRVLAEIEEIRQDPSLEGIELLLWHNAGEEITKSLSGLLRAGALGALLAALVLIFFLRKFSATLIIGFSIPFSIIAAVGFLFLSGKTLNVMSMMGLMLATGMLVDNAVVVLESIYQKLEKGTARVTAAQVGTQEVITAVIAATLTSIIIFVPLIFGQKSRYSLWLGETGTAIIFALICSLFISLTLIPLAMARLLRMDVNQRSKWQQWIADHVEPVFVRLGRRVFRRQKAAEVHEPPARGAPDFGGGVTGAYLRLVSWPLGHRFLVGLVMIPLIIYGSYWWLMNKVPDNTPGAQELGELWIEYEFSENFHYAKIERDYIMPVEQFLLANKERFKITDVLSFYRNNQAWMDVYFDKDKVTLEEMPEIRKQMTDGLPVIPGAKIQLGSQRGAQNRDWIRANLYGDDPETLQELAAEAKLLLLKRSDFTDVWTDLRSGQEEVQIRLNRSLAGKYGVSPQSVSGILSIVARGRQVRGYRTPEGEVDIFVRIRPEDLESLNDLKSLVVGSGPAGRQILLSQVADLQIQKIPAELRREDRRTYTRLTAMYSGDKKSEGRKHVSQVMNSLDYPQGYGWSYGFWTQRQEQDDQAFWFNICLALFMVYFVMASLFESLAHPFAIMFSLPFAVVGVAWFLFITGTPFNMMAWIGSMVLIGIVVNNGIVLIDHINNLRRKGMPRSQAILEGCRERLRPIVMTASTTIVGLIPLAWGDTAMWGMRYFPMARTIMGGLMASTILTLVVLPTYYTLFDDLAIWIKQTWYASDPSLRQSPEQSPAPTD